MQVEEVEEVQELEKLEDVQYVEKLEEVEEVQKVEEVQDVEELEKVKEAEEVFFVQVPSLFLWVPWLFLWVSFASLEPLVEGRQLSLVHFLTFPLGNLSGFEFFGWKDRVREMNCFLLRLFSLIDLVVPLIL